MKYDDEFKFGNDEFELPMQTTDSQITNSEAYRTGQAGDHNLVETESMTTFKPQESEQGGTGCG